VSQNGDSNRRKPPRTLKRDYRQRDTRYEIRKPDQYVNTSIRSTLECQYALPFRGHYGPDLTQPSVSLSQSDHCDQEKWF